MSRLLRVGEVACSSGKSVRAIHLYEEMGLIRTAARTEGRYRLFAEETLERVAWISDLQTLGMSLSQIRRMVSEFEECELGTDAMCYLRTVYQQKLEGIRETIRSLQKLENELDQTLEHLDACPRCAPARQRAECRDCQVEKGVGRSTLISGVQTADGWGSGPPSSLGFVARSRDPRAQ